MLHRGPIPPGMNVLHKCDVGLCVNPYHLFLGTHADNVADRHRKSRDAKGSRNGGYAHKWQAKVKLSRQQVQLIRATYVPRKISLAKVAQMFGVSPATIYQVVARKTHDY